MTKLKITKTAKTVKTTKNYNIQPKYKKKQFGTNIVVETKHGDRKNVSGKDGWSKQQLVVETNFNRS